MSEVVIPVIREIDSGLAERLGHCGDFVYVAKCRNCGSSHFVGFNRCRSRYCVNCSRVKALAYFRQIMQRIQENNVKYAYMLDLTLRNMDDLVDMVSLMLKYWRKFYNGKSVRSVFVKRFSGWFRSMEIKKGKGSGKWHVHWHVLLVSDEYSRDYDWIKDEWKRITNGEGSVWIEGVSPLYKGVLEVCKYILKPALYTVEEWREILQALKNVKQVGAGGIFRGIKQRVERDLETIEEDVLVRFVCRVCGMKEADLYEYLYSDLQNEVIWDMIGGSEDDEGSGEEDVSRTDCCSEGGGF